MAQGCGEDDAPLAPALVYLWCVFNVSGVSFPPRGRFVLTPPPGSLSQAGTDITIGLIVGPGSALSLCGVSVLCPLYLTPALLRGVLRRPGLNGCVSAATCS